MIEFHEPTLFGARIIFSHDAVLRFRELRQSILSPESGGMLFVKETDGYGLLISNITGPSLSDKRRRWSYSPDPVASQITIDSKFNDGLHYVGDWHSHPQRKPSPSKKDLTSIKSLFNRSTHTWNFMVHVIVPYTGLLENAYVTLTNGKHLFPCKRLM